MKAQLGTQNSTIQYSVMDKLKLVWKERKNHLLAYAFITPFMLCFAVFVLIPVLLASALSFFYFNSLEAPRFVGWDNFRVMFTQDVLLMKYVIPNTFKFAIFVGPVAYAMQFTLAWMVNQIPSKLRSGYTMALYLPSITGGVMMGVVWTVVFSADRLGYLNNFLITMGFMENPVDWTQDKNYLMSIMIFVTVWGSAGINFLTLLAGLQNVDPQLYEAGKIDGIRNRLQEVWYITIPSMKPQMMFAAVMGIIGALKAGDIGPALSGQNPTPGYAGQMLQNHIGDYGFTRYELGYATALNFLLLGLIFSANQICRRFLVDKEAK